LAKLENMKNNVKIYDNSDVIIDLYKRLEITNGVEPGVGYDIYNLRKYKDNAIKPKNNWRPLNEKELSLIMTKEKMVSTNNQIGIVKIPDDLLMKFKEVGFQNISDYKEFSNLFKEKSENLEEAMVLVTDFFSYLIKDTYSISNVELLCFSYERPNLETIAYSQTTNEYFGLHFDSSVGNKIFERKNNPNRLSINIGSEPRYLIFTDIDMKQMYDMLLEKDSAFKEEKEKLNDSALAYKFFETFPNYPVYRFMQKPYEAYIAPTDNVIHDGSTLGKKKPDMTIVFTGYFNIN